MSEISVEDAARLNIKSVIMSLIISAFGFVAALFWRDAIQAFINEIVPKGEGLRYQFLSAIFVTIIAVIVIYIISRYLMRVSVKEVVEKGLAKRANDKKLKRIISAG